MNNNNQQLITIFDDMEDLLNQYIDKIEITPIQLINNIYVTGIKRSTTSLNEIELHLKEIRKINLKGVNTTITDEEGWFMMEPDGEMWINTKVINEIFMTTINKKIYENIQQLNTFHVMTTTYRKNDKNDFTHTEITIYENKKVACKDALAMRKKYKNVSNKFQMYNKQGEIITTQNTKQYEPTDFELITKKIE